MEMLPILPTMLTDFPTTMLTDFPTTMLTDELLTRLKLLKKLSDIELCVLLTVVRFCILISYHQRDQTADTD